jgi:PIN domain nuclease of toxin-antitoxin system
VRLLLDTHVLLWALGDPDKLDASVRSVIEDAESHVVYSAASTWEIAIKAALRKLDMPVDLRDQLVAARLEPLQITTEHSLEAGALPRHHGDPFDRMLIAQAQLEQLTIVTRDPRFALYDVDVLAA